ncbi:alcohol dehydrogenase catalytic domain-containing protein [Mesorhizobium sp. dw_380]|uniref:alcohol dehydrogenase catalytic domain-containing protein n=1 Tax=Mesorhizobium sp. dw_380 TaxID=2812001 RepID=UPI001BDDCCB8|nr:alcohol dehydrogenase catalytic domain-containing protein [Mesorhizobium sp. dw_380]
MKAVAFDRPGPAEDVLNYREVPFPTYGPKQVLVRVTARVVQPADWLFIADKYSTKPSYPQVAGFDAAGIVEAVGADVRELEAGRRVAFRSPGAWAEYAAVPAERIYPVSTEFAERLSDEVVCQFPLNPLTAWGLLDQAMLKPGQRVLLTAARSVVAAVVDQLASERKAIVERLYRDNGGYRLCDSGNRTIGIGGSVADALADAKPYDLILDPVGGPDTLALIARAAPGAALFSYGVLDDRPMEIKASSLLYKALHWRGFALSIWQNKASTETLAAAAKDCWSILSRYPEKLPVVARYGLEDFATALPRARASAGEGKVVLI